MTPEQLEAERKSFITWTRMRTPAFVEIEDHHICELLSIKFEVWLARAELADAQSVDAERYRWLRNHREGFDIGVCECDTEGGEDWVFGYPPDELDAAIDAARAQS